MTCAEGGADVMAPKMECIDDRIVRRGERAGDAH